MKTVFIYIALFSLLASCMQAPSASRKKSGEIENSDDGIKKSSDVVYDPGSLGNLDDSYYAAGEELSLQKTVKLTSIIDPLPSGNGAFKTKVSIPKNYSGYLYIGAIGLGGLKDKFVSVSFKFGRDLEPIIVPATITKAAGMTPQVDIDVLVVNLSDRPFEKIKLLYQLFDYNSYAATDTPTLDPLNDGLYCRGLKLKDDNTFKSSNTNTLCDEASEKCYYAYALIRDSGLFYKYGGTGNWVPSVISQSQIDIRGVGYANSSLSDILKRCLPDNIDKSNQAGVLNTNLTSALNFGSSLTLGGTNYTYRGPFYPTDEARWEIKGNARASVFGLWESGFTADTTKSYGYQSRLFPIAGKKPNMRAGVQYFGSSTYRSSRALDSLSTEGESLFMDGCNFRAVDPTIGSCNVTAQIELIVRDPKDMSKSTAYGTTNELKIQLTRQSELNSEGEDVLFSSFKRCDASNECGANECCFNKRCWSRSLVNNCMEDVEAIGNHMVGETCRSDYECASLCCDQARGICANHSYGESQKILCSKSPGETCVSHEWCRQESLPVCKKYKVGTSPQGKVICNVLCFPVLTFGTCLNGTCVAPTPEEIPAFDPTAENACEGAEPLP